MNFYTTVLKLFYCGPNLIQLSSTHTMQPWGKGTNYLKNVSVITSPGCSTCPVGTSGNLCPQAVCIPQFAVPILNCIHEGGQEEGRDPHHCPLLFLWSLSLPLPCCLKWIGAVLFNSVGWGKEKPMAAPPPAPSSSAGRRRELSWLQSSSGLASVNWKRINPPAEWLSGKVSDEWVWPSAAPLTQQFLLFHGKSSPPLHTVVMLEQNETMKKQRWVSPWYPTNYSTDALVVYCLNAAVVIVQFVYQWHWFCY